MIQPEREPSRPSVRGSRRFERVVARLQQAAGLTLMETLIVAAVVGILATITVPYASCMIQRSKMASAMDDVKDARERIELFQTEMGLWPANLAEAYRNQPLPKGLLYCVESRDRNNGRGNECLFFDNGNPSGNNTKHDAGEVGYVLQTEDNLSPCNNVRVVWTMCCGGEPVVVPMDDDSDLPPGHP